MHRAMQNNLKPSGKAHVMPTIRVTIPIASWSVEEKAAIVAKLTKALNEAAEEAGKGDITPYINVHVEETAEGGYAIAGKVVG